MVKSTNRSRNGSDLCVRQPTDQKAGGSNPSRRAKKTRNRKASGLFACISCCFLPLLFSDPNADPNGSGQRKASDGTGEDIPYCLGSFELGVGGHTGISVQREACRVVSEHRGHRFYIHAVLEGAAASRRAGRGFRPPVPLHSPQMYRQICVTPNRRSTQCSVSGGRPWSLFRYTSRRSTR